MSSRSKKITKTQWSWAFYDWANSAFATTVMAGFFPIFFKEYWAAGMEGAESTFYIGSINSIVGLFIAFIAPILGAYADIGGYRKNFLGFFAVIGILATAYLFFIPGGDWFTALIFYGLGVIGFSGGNIFYDSLIVTVSEEKERNKVSSLGFSLGYLGGGLLFVLNVLMYLNPGWFGLNSSTDAILYSFLSVAIWWGIFSIPVFKNVKDPFLGERKSLVTISKESIISVISTIREIKKYKSAALFLLSYWLYMDGVDTIVRMATSYGSDIGLSASSMITALILTQFVGFPATLIFGMYADRIGYKRALSIGILIYIFVTIYGSMIDSATGFFILAGVIGLVQGGVQAISRSFFSNLIPQDRSAEFFGFYNLIGKSAVIVGPFLVSGVALLMSEPRYGILSLLILFIPGLILLWLVPEKDNS